MQTPLRCVFLALVSASRQVCGDIVLKTQATLTKVDFNKLLHRFDVGLGSMHAIVDLIILTEKPGKVGIGNLQLVYPVHLTRKLFRQGMRRVRQFNLLMRAQNRIY